MYEEERKRIIDGTKAEKILEIQKTEQRIQKIHNSNLKLISKRREIRIGNIILLILIILGLLVFILGNWNVINIENEKIVLILEIFGYVFLLVGGFSVLALPCRLATGINGNEYTEQIQNNQRKIESLKSEIKNLQENKPRPPSKRLRIFLSYAVADVDTWHINELYRTLKSQFWIHKLYYYEVDAKRNIILYMNEKINESKVLLLVCTPQSLKSKIVMNEWSTAEALGKIIVPIFNNINDVPPFLRNRRGIPIDLNFNFSVLAKNLKGIIDDIIGE